MTSLGCCDTEIGRVPFQTTGTKSVSMPLKAGEVSFWTDVDIVWEGRPVTDTGPIGGSPGILI